MLIYLMRHGIAIDRDDPTCPPEADRYLTPKGIERVRAAAEGLLNLEIAPQVFLTSPLLRAAQAAETTCQVLGVSPKKLRKTDALLPAAAASLIYTELAKLKTSAVICFGHAPQMDEAIARAVGAPIAFTSLKKAGVACLELEALDPPHGLLKWLMGPGALRRIG